MGETNDKRMVEEHLKDFMENEMGCHFNKDNFTNCINPDHDDRNPSMTIYKGKDGKMRAKCFSCEANYDIFDAVGIHFNLTGADKFNKAHEYYGVENLYQKQDKTEQTDTHEHTHKSMSEEKQDELAQYFQTCQSRINEIDYPAKRGLSDEIVRKAGLGYDPHFTHGVKGGSWQALIIPTGQETYVARNIDPNAPHGERYRKFRGSNLYLMGSIFYAKEPIFIVEGELDALSIMQAGGFAIALGSLTNGDKLVQELAHLKGEGAEGTFIVALDNEEKAQGIAEELTQELRGQNIEAVNFNVFGKYGDANEMLMEAPEELAGILNTIREAPSLSDLAEELELIEYQKTSTASYIEDFLNGVADSVNTRAISTGFKNLDKALDGGLYAGLYTIGAISSLGKTTLILQIADQIAQQGQDVLIFSLEMARTELMSKSISRHTIMEAMEHGIKTEYAKTSRGITDGKRYAKYNEEETKLINNAVNSYKEYANHIYIYEGLGDIGAEHVRNITQKHVRVTGNRPVIIIDYLQILASKDRYSTDKQRVDDNILELKRVSRDFHTPLIAISSFNRAGYKEPVSMASYKESGAVEYSSDVLFGLELKGVGGKDFDVDQAKKKNPREITLKILKNRNGALGDPINFDFYAMFNYFKEK